MGSWQVVSLNCPRAAYRAEGDTERLIDILKELMDNAVELFKIKIGWMDKVAAAGRMPFATQQPKDPVTGKKGAIAVDIDALVCTIGVVGINEMVRYHVGTQLHESKDAQKLALRAMIEMEMYSKELSQEHGIEIALARTPAETTGQRFAISDLLHVDYKEKAMEVVQGDIESALRDINKSRDLPVYYTNGTHTIPGANISLIDRIEIEHPFFSIVAGGNILHIWLGEGAPDARGLKEFAMNISRNTQVGYFAFTKDMSICQNDFHLMSGLKDKCENCGSTDIEQLSRVTGYVQAVGGWNNAKKQELSDRMRYQVKGLV